MEDLSPHVLDIVENSTAAGATLVEITVRLESVRDRLRIVVRDNGRGMDEETVSKVTDPFVTSRTTRRVGLGLALFAQAAREAGGGFAVESKKGEGTTVTAEFQMSHIDCRPMGDMPATIISLIIGSPEVDLICEFDMDGVETIVDTAELKRELEGVCITSPPVLQMIREHLAAGLRET